MTTLTIWVGDTLTAVEVYCGDDVKYVESFSNWSDLLKALSQYFQDYAWIEIRKGVK